MKIKIVKNTCYGGFGISIQAMIELIKRKAKCIKEIPIYEFYDSNYFKNLSPISKLIQYKFKDEMENWKLYEDSNANKTDNILTNQYYFYNWGFGLLMNHDRSIIYEFINENESRMDPDLIEIVEIMKEDANGKHAKLKVVELGIYWDIKEYDGKETVIVQRNSA